MQIKITSKIATVGSMFAYSYFLSEIFRKAQDAETLTVSTVNDLAFNWCVCLVLKSPRAGRLKLSSRMSAPPCLASAPRPATAALIAARAVPYSSRGPFGP